MSSTAIAIQEDTRALIIALDEHYAQIPPGKRSQPLKMNGLAIIVSTTAAPHPGRITGRRLAALMDAAGIWRHPSAGYTTLRNLDIGRPALEKQAESGGGLAEGPDIAPEQLPPELLAPVQMDFIAPMMAMPLAPAPEPEPPPATPVEALRRAYAPTDGSGYVTAAEIHRTLSDAGFAVSPHDKRVSGWVAAVSPNSRRRQTRVNGAITRGYSHLRKSGE